MNQAQNASLPARSVTGGVRAVLQLEGLAVLAAAAAAYFILGGNGWIFGLLFFAPDLSFAGYALGSRVGAAVYNAVHSYVLPLALGVAGWLLGVELVWQVGLIFLAHAGFDRSLGYGLKYGSAFAHTHLGVIGRG